MKDKKIELVNDGSAITKSFMEEWDIEEYCNRFNSKIFISFVGAVVKKDRVLFSYPKHYKANDKEDKCIKQILKIIALNKINKGSFEKGEKGEFPIKPYVDIANYFKKYGIYSSTERYNEKGYDGNIEWNKTINKSNKIIVKNKLIFFPFILNKNRNANVFIGECMQYVLGDAFKYRDIIGLILPYKQKIKNRVFNNLNYVLKTLKRIKNQYFKDSEKKLICSLIDYIEWRSKIKDSAKLITLNFENYWEDMMSVYLNTKFEGYSEDSIIWSEAYNEKNTFEKVTDYVESREGGHSIEYDHYLQKIEDLIYLFDSKYFNQEVSELNYKQLFYNYHLKSRFPNAKIINGLLIPTEKEYYTKVHIDRSGIDGVKIIEHYINLNKVLDCYENNKT